LPDGVEHKRRIAQNSLVPEPDQRKAGLRQPSVAHRIGLCAQGMHAAVQFDNQLQGRTAEVGELGSDRHLPPEFHPLQPTIPQYFHIAASVTVGSARPRRALERVRSVGLSIDRA
jgi:hypothetical protein